MKAGRLHINQMNLRISGLTQEQGQRLGEAVARRLAEMKITCQPGHIMSLSIPLSYDTTSIETLAEQIVVVIHRSLR
jgi:hypothetical protein